METEINEKRENPTEEITKRCETTSNGLTYCSSDGKESACNAGFNPWINPWIRRFNPWIRRILWRREWQPTPVFLPGESHGQRNLVGCSPWGHKESDMTEQSLVNIYVIRIPVFDSIC